MTPSHDQQLGALQSDIANVKEDVAYIRNHMVTRREFEDTASEHDEFKSQLRVLQDKEQQRAVLFKWAERIMWVCITAGTAAVLGVSI